MTDLASQLERLGLEQYLDAFIGEGFDTWDTLCDVQESDLEALNVKLGHRRKLQRAIAGYRGISYERLVGSPVGQEVSSDSSRIVEGPQGVSTSKEGTSGPPAETKRKYRRHPKTDENAPDKPPSAYVLFSNKIREEVKADQLSFTEIAKLVGERWQKLDPAQKEPFESQAASLKEQYNIQLSAYKKTDAYKDYQQYLGDFKLKHNPQSEPKRPKLDPQSSGGSASAASVEVLDALPTVGHGRVGSVSSVSAASLASAMTSPSGIPMAPSSSLPNIAGTATRGFPALPRASSPQAPHYRDRRLIGQLSSQSSTSDDSGQVPYEALSRTATLSLSTPPTGTPPMPSHALGNIRPDLSSGSVEGFQWPPRAGLSLQPGSITPSGPGSLGSGITLPSPTFSSDPWRERGIEWPRQMQTPPASIVPQAQTLPLPPLLGHDCMSELSQNQAQRTLPPLRQTSSHASSSTAFSSTTPTGPLSRPGPGEHDRRYLQSFESANRQLDRHENEAANTLAGLATSPDSETPHSRSHNRRRP